MKKLINKIPIVVVLAVTASIGLGQVPSATPTPDQRGLGVESSRTANSNQSGQQSREAKPELVLQTGYNNFFGATRLVFSPDGRLLATGTFRSSTIKLWDTETGRELRNLSSGRQSAMGMSPFIAFSRDSRLVAAAAGENTVKVWEVTSGREVQTLASGEGGIASSLSGISFIAFTSNDRIVTIGDAVRVWDVTTARVLSTVAGDTLNASALMGGDGGAALSRDGTQLARISTQGEDQVKFWDLATGRETRAVKLSDREIENVTLEFAADGHLLVAGTVDKRVKLWDVTTNAKERDLGSTGQDFSLLKFSRDTHLLAMSEGYAIKLWDVATGRELPALKAPNSGLFSTQARVFTAFSEDGKKFATGGFDTPTILWATETAKQLVKLTGRTNMAYKVAFSADGNQLYSGGRTRWDLRTGRGLRISAAPGDNQLGFPSPDGRLLATFAPNNNTVTILETPTGRKVQTLTPTGETVVQRAGFSPDGSMLVVTYGPGETQTKHTQASSQLATTQNQIKIWEVKSGRELRTLSSGAGATEVGFGPDGRVLVTLGVMGEISLWDTASGSKLGDFTSSPMAGLMQMMNGIGGMSPDQLRKMKPGKPGSMPQMPDMTAMSDMITNMMGSMSAGTMGRSVTSMSFSPDGRILAIGGVESKSNLDLAAMMNPAAQKQKKNSKPPDADEIMKSMKIEAVGQVTLWDVASGQQIGAFKGHGKGVTHVAFSRDGRLLASSSSDNTIRIWDVAGRRELRTLAGHTANIDSIDFSPDSRLLASAGDDGATFLWDANTGEHLLTLISLDDGSEWMVVTPQGLFDGTPAAWNQILWRYNQDTFNVAPIEWFFNEFYYPGLLGDVIASKRPKVALDVSKKDRRQPIVKLSIAGNAAATETGIATRTIRVKVEVTDAPADKDNRGGSGARDVRLFRNGSLVKVWHGDVLNGKPTTSLEEEITVTSGSNRLTAYAFNKDNVKSKDAQLALTGADSLKRAGTAYILAVGINDYANPQYNLKYAVADAQSFGDEVRLRQKQVAQFERVEVIPLINENATKANILSVLRQLAGVPGPPSLKAGPLEKIRRADPEDTVIIYFAGHGTAQAQRFYLIPHDLGYTGERTKLNERDLQAILNHSISDAELEQAVEGLDAGHLLLVIDACNSGQALDAEEKRRGPMNSKGLAQLAYEKGMYILTAAQSYQAALEAAQLGHGLLTYALIEEGLKTVAADTEPKDGVLSAREWLDFATERVPQIQEAKMKQGRGIGLEIAFTEGEQNIADPEKRSLQRPRVFYRRELEGNPLVIAKP
ncbi:MAG TPA: caspase family protein [Pyrinomonadaceae bacterium]|nr:caspase family protein [Pyrinomonadaceae bacterium]